MTILEKIREVNGKQGKENFEAGMRFEFKVMRDQRKNSLVVMRSAGSHSLIDIVAYKKNQQTWLISCKRNGRWLVSELEALRKFQSKIHPSNKIKLAYYYSEKKYTIINL